jgi:hypothetical protein
LTVWRNNTPAFDLLSYFQGTVMVPVYQKLHSTELKEMKSHFVERGTVALISGEPGQEGQFIGVFRILHGTKFEN